MTTPVQDPWDTERITTGRELRDEGMASAENRIGAEQDVLVIDQAIKHLIDIGREFSANDVRDLIPVVHPPLIGSRFLQAARRGLIVRVGEVQSTYEEAHARRVATWIKASNAPQANAKQAASNLLTGDGNSPSLAPEHEAAIRSAHYELEHRGHGKSGPIIRSLLDVLGTLTGITGSTDALL